jgi:hypothetical protein
MYPNNKKIVKKLNVFYYPNFWLEKINMGKGINSMIKQSFLVTTNKKAF